MVIPTSIAGIDVAQIASVVDARPIGGAALSGGTSGGGTLQAALESGAWREVQTPEELFDAVSGDTPSIVLIHPGDYDLATDEITQIETCETACAAGQLLASETQPARKCDTGTATAFFDSNVRRLRIGSNKTIIGLGAGATLHNAQLELSGSNNVILRNLEIADVNATVKGSGSGIVMWPSHHVWVDHCSFARCSHSAINIVSNWDQEAADYALIDAASHITLSWNHFNGASDATCSGGQSWNIGTQRNPALTIHHNWISSSEAGSPYLFGSETWGHVFNNVISDVKGSGLAVSCGASGVVEANVFERAPNAIYLGDEGAPTWPFCATGLFGIAWAPVDAPEDPANNLLDETSTLRLADQTLEGIGLILPVVSGSERTVTVPLSTGNESYAYELEAPSAEWAASLRLATGIGHLF